MYKRNRVRRRVAAAASLTSLITLLPGCGLLSHGGPDDSSPIVVGTTSAPSTLDPAGAWDGSWELFRNVYQTLLAYPNGATTPQPDAAESCAFTDSTSRTYRCRLRAGLEFTDGHPLDAEAVRHSIDRIRIINAPSGPAGLLGGAGPGGDRRRPAGRLPPEDARCHLPVRAGDPRHVDRRPARVPPPAPCAPTTTCTAPVRTS